MDSSSFHSPKDKDGRFHIDSELKQESLVSRKVLSANNTTDDVLGMVPGVSLVSVGGLGIMDAGKDAILSVVNEIVECKNNGCKMVVGVGGGARMRHTFAVGSDLGIPSAGLARISGGAEEQNRDILQFLLAPHGGLTFVKDHFQDLQLFLRDGLIPICIGQPPYHFWEPPPRFGVLPDNGPDVGLLMMAEVIGAERIVLLKDVDGVFDSDPKKNPDAKLIRNIAAKDLLELKLPTMPIEREMVATLAQLRKITEVRVINGRVAGNLSKALQDDTSFGTTITRV
ncbi:MAG: uridylate kinase [Alcanivorax sp.]|jgi:uridylate kinase